MLISAHNFCAITMAIASAAASKSGRQVGEIVPWLILLAGIVLIGGIVILFIRRWLKSEESSATAGFTLQDLREMHARGELSDAEFQNARSAMIGRLGAAAAQSKSEDAGSSPGNQ